MPFCPSLFVFIVIKIITQRWLLYPFFTCYVCLFCLRIVLNIMEFDATVIQVRDLASYKTRFNPSFSTFENACTKSGIWQFLSIRFLCVLSFDFAMWLGTFRFDFPLSLIFLCFYILRKETEDCKYCKMIPIKYVPQFSFRLAGKAQNKKGIDIT